jgi:hypothetical protein
MSLPEPTPLSNLIVQIVRKIAKRNGVSIERATEEFKNRIHRRAEELRQQRQHEWN